ncbi:MAG: GTP-binding protein, partial [Bacteroidota bacterium]
MAEKIRSIGIFSHVDAGKTTITEQFLFLSGATKSAGDVNKGTTVTDHLDVERERGVSVRSADVSFMWKNHRINLVDTPGHADFASEVERALRVIDGAILVVSAVEGVQAHTYALWDALKNRKIPVIIFINKTDRQGANFGEVLKSLESELRLLTFPLFAPHREGEADASVIKIRRSVQDLVPGDF